MIKIKQLLDAYPQTTEEGSASLEITDLQIKPKEFRPRIDGQFMGKRSKSALLQNPNHSMLSHCGDMPSARSRSSPQHDGEGIVAFKILLIDKNEASVSH